MSGPAVFAGRPPAAVVTGGSRGIGRAIAAALLREGARLLLVARDPERLAATARALDPSGRSVHPFSVDLAAPEAAERVRSEADRRLGSVDWLVNNAGGALADRFDRLPREEVDRELLVNLAAPVRLSRAFLPDLLARRSGHLLHVGSAIADWPSPRLAVYAATKSGLRAFSLALDLEVRSRGVRSTVIEPIYVRTDFGRRPGEAVSSIDRLARRHPHLVLAPERVAEAVVGAIRRPRPAVRVPLAWAAGRLVAVPARPLAQGFFGLPPPSDDRPPDPSG